MGLSLLDQAAMDANSKPEFSSKKLKELFDALYSAVLEMHEIDSFLTRDMWKLAFQHLIVRRIIWEFTEKPEDGQIQIFSTNDLPQVSELIDSVKNDALELISVLLTILANNVSLDLIKVNLSQSNIDISRVLNSARCLNRTDPRKYPLDEKQLCALEPLLG
jgi:hypothetical protein